MRKRTKVSVLKEAYKIARRLDKTFPLINKKSDTRSIIDSPGNKNR